VFGFRNIWTVRFAIVKILGTIRGSPPNSQWIVLGVNSMCKFRVSLFGLALCFSSLLLMGQTQTTILGSVRDKSGAAMPQVKVDATNKETSQSFSAVSGSDGTFRLNVPVGDYSVRYYAEGFKTGLASFKARPGEAGTLDLIFPPEVLNGEIHVHVDDSGKPAGNVSVTITSSSGQDLQGDTDSDGNYVQRSLAGGLYRVAVDAGSHPCRKIKIADGQSKSVSLKLSDHCR
jgi:hypothetical protein